MSYNSILALPVIRTSNILWGMIIVRVAFMCPSRGFACRSSKVPAMPSAMPKPLSLLHLIAGA